jgi:predicted SAM-dependent methyltransferase
VGITYCPVCGDVFVARRVYRDRGFSIVRCGACGIILRPPEEHTAVQPSENESLYYRESVRCGTGNKLFFRLTFEALIKAFPRLAGSNFLDIGCGIGNAVEVAGELGFNAVGVESSVWARAYCRKKGLRIYDSLCSVKEEGMKFKVINLNHVLEHISSPIGFLMDEVGGFLDQGGFIRIEVPDGSFFSLKRLLPVMVYNVTSPRAEHLYYYTPQTLRDVVERSGYRVVGMSREGFGDRIRHQATMSNPNRVVRAVSTFLYASRFEKITRCTSFLVALVQKK